MKLDSNLLPPEVSAQILFKLTEPGSFLPCYKCQQKAIAMPVGATAATRYICPDCSDVGVAEGANLDRCQHDDFKIRPAQSQFHRGIQRAACRAAWVLSQPHLEILPKRQQIVYFLADVLGLPNREVASYLRITVLCVHQHLKLARRKLRSYDDTGKPLSATERYQHSLRIDQDQLLRGAAITRDDPDPAALVRFMHVARGKPRGAEKGAVTIESLTDC